MKRFLYSDLFVIFCFIFFATLIYTAWLSTIPFQFHGDEAETALQALHLPKNPFSVFQVGWYDLPLLSFVSHAMSMKIFGETIFGDRIGAVLFGVLSLPITYALMKQETDKKTAIITTVLLGTSHAFIALSRIGTIYMQSAFISLAANYFFLLAVKKQQVKFSLISGFFAGLCFYSYYAARLSPIIIIFVFLFSLLFKKYRTPKNLLLGSSFLISMSITMLPQLIFFVTHQQSFVSRTQQVFLFSKQNTGWLESVYGNQPALIIFLSQAVRSLNIFAGDSSGQYGYKGMTFDPFTIIFFLFGLVQSFRKKTFFNFFITTILFFTILFGQILTIPPGFLPRFVVGLPMFFMLVGVGFEQFFHITRRLLKKYTFLFEIGIVMLIVLLNLYMYFFDYPSQEFNGKTGDANAITARKIVNILSKIDKSEHITFMTSPSFVSSFAPIEFLLPSINKDDIDAQAFIKMPYTKTMNTVFVLLPIYQNALEKLTTSYKNGRYSYIYDSEGRTIAITYWTQDR